MPYYIMSWYEGEYLDGEDWDHTYCKMVQDDETATATGSATATSFNNESDSAFSHQFKDEDKQQNESSPDLSRKRRWSASSIHDFAVFEEYVQNAILENFVSYYEDLNEWRRRSAKGVGSIGNVSTTCGGIAKSRNDVEESDQESDAEYESLIIKTRHHANSIKLDDTMKWTIDKETVNQTGMLMNNCSTTTVVRFEDHRFIQSSIHKRNKVKRNVSVKKSATKIRYAIGRPVRYKDFRVRLFICEYCDNSYLYKHGLEMHEKIEHQIVRKQFKQDQIVNKAPIFKNYKCKLCNASFNGSQKRQKHVDAKHGGFNKYKCAVKNKKRNEKRVVETYAQKATEELAVTSNENQEIPKKLSCQFCSRKFTKAGPKAIHEKSCRMNTKLKFEEVY